MPAVGLTPAEFLSVFGPRADDAGPGRYRLCRSCGDWHSLDRRWPHNCRPPAPPRNPDLATPQIAPPFEPFRTGMLDGAVTIGSRAEKRAYMDRHDLVEWDDGVKPDREPSERDQKREFAEQVKRFAETDPLNIEPVDVIGRTDLNEAPEIATDGMQVFDD